MISYLIRELSAVSILSTAYERDGKTVFEFDATDPAKEFLVNETVQADCPMFYQLMKIKNQDRSFTPSENCPDLKEILIYVDFTGIFDRYPSPLTAGRQKLSEKMFTDEGVFIHFGYGLKRYIAFERSANMSRASKISFIREDYYESIRERITLGMKIGKCQLSKLYAYNGLMFSTSYRANAQAFLWDRSMIVVDNPKTLVKDVDVITVKDDGTENAMREYTRIAGKQDITITEFDGEGLLSPKAARYLGERYEDETLQRSFQIRLPYIKGVLHEVDFKGLFNELGVEEITDIWGEKHRVFDVEIILTKSMFKGFGWMTENGLSWKEYLKRCVRYDHDIYVSGSDRLNYKDYTELNYQFISTLAVTEEEFRPKDLPLGWRQSPENDTRNWLTKTTETVYYGYVADYEGRKRYFEHDSREKAKLVRTNEKWIDEKSFTKELDTAAKNILMRYSTGNMLISGDVRYFSDDLIRFLAILIKNTYGENEAYNRLEAEFLSGNTAFAPKNRYPKCEHYTLLRNPHIARNEEAIVEFQEKVGYFRDKYLSGLHYVLMVSSLSMIPERLGGADFDGDLIKTVADPLLNECVMRNYTDGVYLPLLKIPAAEPLIGNADDWNAKFAVIKSTFSSRVGQISNAAFNRSVLAYDENSPEDEESYRNESEILAILTGLEIDSAKSGVKPDLTEYLSAKPVKRSSFLQYKAIVKSDDRRPWYKPTKAEDFKKFYDSVDWDSVTSNVEKLPYYAFQLEKQTVKYVPTKHSVEDLIPVKEANWKDDLDPVLIERMKELIAHYEEAFRRVRYLKKMETSLSRRSDVAKILFAKGLDKAYSIDDLYAQFEYTSPEDIRRARIRISDLNWHFTPPDQRHAVAFEIFPNQPLAYKELFFDFSHNGYRLLSDIVCDLDDLNRVRAIQKHLPNKKDDHEDMKVLMKNVLSARNYRDAIIANAGKLLRILGRYDWFDPKSAVLCAMALGKRDFVIEVMPQTVVSLYDADTPKRKGWFRRK